MKKVFLTSMFILCLVLIELSAFAGSIDYLSNQSADYIRMFSRNGATEGADIAVYNPAGTAFLKQGMYFQVSHQTIFKTYKDELKAGTPSDGTYKTTLPTYFLPGAFAIYNGGNWAGFLAATVTAGGGSVDYKDGIPTYPLWGLSATPITMSYVGGNLKATSLYPQLTLGGSYALNDMISFSAGVRGIYGYKSYEGSVTLTNTTYAVTRTYSADAIETAFGAGAILGFDIRPTKGLLFAVRYETQTSLRWKTKVNDGKDLNGTFVDGKSHRKDLPSMIGIGLSYVIFDRITAIASFDGFFIGMADNKKDVANESTIYRSGYNDHYDSFGYEASLGFDVAVIPEFLKLSAGYMYNKVGGNKYTYSDFEYALDSHNFGVGGKVTPISNLDVTFGVSHSIYIDGTNTQKVTYKKMNYIFGLSVEYRVY